MQTCTVGAGIGLVLSVLCLALALLSLIIGREETAFLAGAAGVGGLLNSALLSTVALIYGELREIRGMLER